MVIAVPRKSTSPKPQNGNPKPTAKRKKKTVNRDVGAQSKGPRLQRLRAALLLFSAKQRHPESRPAIAVEFHGDVFQTSMGSNGNESYHEEDKNYASGTRFSLISDQILNSIVSFLDCWIALRMSTSVAFGFYTPNDFKKETTPKHLIKLGVIWPDKPVLELLASREFDHEHLIDSFKTVVCDYYARQAATLAEEEPPIGAIGLRPLRHLELIKNWRDEDWISFLKQLDWKFGEGDAKTIGQELRKAVQNCNEYSSQFSGKEDLIISRIVDLIDDRQSAGDITQKLVDWRDVTITFQNVASGEIKLPDPAWKIWEQLEKPTDTRNLRDKILSICPGFSKKQLEAMSLRVTHAMIERQSYEEDRSALALRFQIYSACQMKLLEIQEEKQPERVKADVVKGLIDQIDEIAKAKYHDCSKTYQYTIKSESSVSLMVLDLIENCFLSFDNGGTE